MKTKTPIADDAVIAAGTRIVGTIRCDEPLRIGGRVVGSVDARSALVIERAGLVRGHVRAPELEIHGIAVGSIRVAGRARIAATARVQGELEAQRLGVERGAQLQVDLDIRGDAEARGAPWWVDETSLPTRVPEAWPPRLSAFAPPQPAGPTPAANLPPSPFGAGASRGYGPPSEDRPLADAGPSAHAPPVAPAAVNAPTSPLADPNTSVHAPPVPALGPASATTAAPARASSTTLPTEVPSGSTAAMPAASQHAFASRPTPVTPTIASSIGRRVESPPGGTGPSGVTAPPVRAAHDLTRGGRRQVIFERRALASLRPGLPTPLLASLPPAHAASADPRPTARPGAAPAPELERVARPDFDRSPDVDRAPDLDRARDLDRAPDLGVARPDGDRAPDLGVARPDGDRAPDVEDRGRAPSEERPRWRARLRRRGGEP